MNMKKILCLLLAGLMAIAPLTACTDGTGTESDTESASVSESETDSETEIETAPETPNPIDLLRLGGVNISEFSIVCAADLPSVQQTTVQCLVDRIAAATGVTLPIITPDQSAEHEIVFGNGVRENAKVDAAVAEIKNDGYALVMDDGDLYIAASTERGVVYGAYDLMEKYLGVRFYAADSIQYKEANIIDIPADLKDVYSPAFAYRGGNWHNVWGDYGYAAAKANEGSMVNYGDDITLVSYSGHYLSMFLDSPGPKYNEDDPSTHWRYWDDSGWASPQPCLTSEDNYQKILANVLKYISEGNYDSVRVGQNDNTQYCTCENCAALNEKHGSAAGSHMVFINRLAADVAKTYPNVKIQTYAYTYSAKPPKDLVMHENVIINYCFMAACFSHAFNDPNCATNKSIAEDLKAWRKICTTMTIYDYGNNFGSNKYVDPNLYALYENVHFLAELGVDGYGTETWNKQGGDFDELRNYLIRQVMWNPNMTKEEYLALMDDFMTAYYGEAAPLLMQYINGVTENSYTPGYAHNGIEVVEFGGCTSVYTPNSCFYNAYNADGTKNTEFTMAMWVLWEQAETCELTEEQLAHVERASIHFYSWCVDYLTTRTEIRKAAAKLNELMPKYGIEWV